MPSRENRRGDGRGFCGIGIFHAKHECNVGTLFRSAYCFGADFVFTVGKRYSLQSSDTPRTYRHVPLYEYRDLDDLITHLPFSCPLVGVELVEKARPLTSFCHPERACYLLGAEDHGLPTSVLNRCHLLVQIEELAMCLNVASTGTVVLYDRMKKRKGGG